MKILLQAGPVRVALGEAVLDGRPFDARFSADLASLAAAAGWMESVRTAEQVHGTRILEDGDDGGGDAFVVEAGQAAAIRIADCWPVVVADPVLARAVVAHCGWRGAAGGLAGASARRLLGSGSRPGDLVACLGPGIAASSFEVGPEVAAAFPAEVRSRTSWGTVSVDLGAFLRRELEACGVRPERIVLDARDTFADRSLHSHRRDAAHAGRMACLCMVGRVGTIPLRAPNPENLP